MPACPLQQIILLLASQLGHIPDELDDEEDELDELEEAHIPDRQLLLQHCELKLHDAPVCKHAPLDDELLLELDDDVLPH